MWKQKIRWRHKLFPLVFLLSYIIGCYQKYNEIFKFTIFFITTSLTKNATKRRAHEEGGEIEGVSAPIGAQTFSAVIIYSWTPTTQTPAAASFWPQFDASLRRLEKKFLHFFISTQRNDNKDNEWQNDYLY